MTLSLALYYTFNFCNPFQNIAYSLNVNTLLTQFKENPHVQQVNSLIQYLDEYITESSEHVIVHIFCFLVFLWFMVLAFNHQIPVITVTAKCMTFVKAEKVRFSLWLLCYCFTTTKHSWPFKSATWIIRNVSLTKVNNFPKWIIAEAVFIFIFIETDSPWQLQHQSLQSSEDDHIPTSLSRWPYV